MKYMIRLLLICVLILLLVFVSFLVAITITGQGRIEPFYIENSIAEKTFININGRENGLIIRGKNLDNPVLLFISGGPGVPEYWLNEAYTQQYPNRLEEEFTVCWWDYMGEGLSYDSEIDPEEITIEKLSSDATAVAEYLQTRFQKEKIYLMAHSGGTPLGLYLAQEKPEQFYCYFSMGQVVNEGNRRYEDGYAFLKEQFETTHNQKGLRYLNSLVKEENGKLILLKPETIFADWEKVLLLGGCATTKEMRSNVTEIFFPQMFSSCYTVSEKINYWRGKELLSRTPYAKYQVPLTQEKPAQIPVYFFSGYYDYTTPVTLVQEFYENLEAPEKRFYLFENSAHSPLWEENEKVLEAMKTHVK